MTLVIGWGNNQLPGTARTVFTMNRFANYWLGNATHTPEEIGAVDESKGLDSLVVLPLIVV